jgi:hypothetical protein
MSKLDAVQKELDKIYKDTSTNIILFAVEFDEKGFPSGKLQKVVSAPGITLGGLDMISRMIDDTYESTHKKIDLAGDLSDSLQELFSKMGITDIDQIEDKIKNISDTETREELFKALKKMRGQFGGL